MSRRPAIKVLLPLFTGVCADSIFPSGVNTLQLFFLSVILLILAVVLFKRTFPLFTDSALILFFFISGAVAVTDEETQEGMADKKEELPRTVIMEISGFSDQLRNDRIRVEGRLLYLSEEGGFRESGQTVLIYLQGRSKIPSPGDLVVANGVLSLPDRRKNPGGASQLEIFRQKGMSWLFRSKQGEWSHLIGGRDLGSTVSFKNRLRRKAGNLIDDLYPEDSAGFLKGILLGARGQISRERKEDFSKAGIYHILAISGLHVGIISGILLLIFTILRLHPLLRVVAVAPVLYIYGSITGMKPSIQRAVVMMTSIILAFSMQRKIDLVNLLYLVAMIFVVISPITLWNTGFQMSFLATWGILALYPGINRALQSLSLFRLHIIRQVFQIFLVSICAQAPLVPVMASSFHRISLVSPLTNIIALPVVALLLPSGLLSLGALALSPVFSAPFSEVTTILIDLLYGLSRVISDIPSSTVGISPFSLPGVAGYYLILFLTSQVLEGRGKWEIIPVIFLILGLLRLVVDLCSGTPPLRVTFLDIGQGDSAVIEFPTGESMMVDCGPSRFDWNAGEAVIDPFLLDRKIDRIDILAFSHPQLDHIGGLLYLLDRYRVDAIIEPGQPTYLNQYIQILGLTLDRKVPLYLPRRGDSFDVAGVSVRFFHPTGEWFGDHPGQDEVNDVSLVVKITHGDISFLLTGDIGPVVEEELVNAVGAELNADILKVAHHGSRVSTKEPFLQSVNPSVAVVSSGRGNPFGHPSPSLITLLQERDISVMRTDIHGAIVFVVEQDRFEVLDGSGDLLLKSEDVAGRNLPARTE